jgi:hypothetical protein
MNEYTLHDATNEDLQKFYDKEAYCMEGFVDDKESYDTLADVIRDWVPGISTIEIYRCKGILVNQKYHLTGDNAYQDDLTFVFIDWQEFGKGFDVVEHKEGFRYFSDVVDNNARIEIVKHNDNYRNFHTLYGDDWFYHSTLEMYPELYEDEWFRETVNKLLPDFDWEGGK